MLNISIRRKAKQFSKLVRHSAVTRRTGQSQSGAPVWKTASPSYGSRCSDLLHLDARLSESDAATLCGCQFSVKLFYLA